MIIVLQYHFALLEKCIEKIEDRLDNLDRTATKP